MLLRNDTHGYTGMCVLQCAATCCSALHGDLDVILHNTHSYAGSVCCSVCRYVALWCTNISMLLRTARVAIPVFVSCSVL